MTAYGGEDVEQGWHSSIAAESANLDSHFGSQYDSFSENWESVYLNTLGIYWKGAHTTQIIYKL